MNKEEYESGYIPQAESGESGSEYSLSDYNASNDAARDIVDKEAAEIVNAIIVSNDDAEINHFLDKFNQNMSKKNLLRILKFGELLDKVSDEALDRIENHPDELTHAELINYIKVTQESISNAKKPDAGVESIKPITLNQQNNTVNVNVNADGDTLTRQSKERIMEAVKKLLSISLSEEDVIDSSETTGDGNKK